jgi:hypothetical protein
MHRSRKDRLAATVNGLASLDTAVRALETTKIVLGAVPGLGPAAKAIVEIGIEILHTAQVRKLESQRSYLVTYLIPNNRKLKPISKT